MDVSDFIRRRCESLRGQAEADGLEPRSALFYWGDVQWLWEIVRQERGIERPDSEWHSYCRVSLAESVLDQLRRGTLVATALNKGDSFRCRVEADHWQDYKAGESLHDLRWSLNTASTRNRALALPEDLSEAVLARISGTLKRFRDRERIASVADRLPHTATGWPDLPVMRQIAGVQRKMANDRALERYNERCLEERPPQLAWWLPTEIAGDARHYSLFSELSDLDDVLIRDPTNSVPSSGQQISSDYVRRDGDTKNSCKRGLVAGQESVVDCAVLSSRQIDDGRYCAEMAVSAPVLCLSEEAVIEELLGYADIGDMTKSVIGKMARGMRRSLSQNRFDVEFWRAFRAKAEERGISLRKRGRPPIK